MLKIAKNIVKRGGVMYTRKYLFNTKKKAVMEE